MKRDLFLTTEKDAEMDTPLRQPETRDTLKGVRSNIVQSIRAFRVQDLQEAASALGQHFLYANLAPAQSKQDVLDMIAQQFTFPAHIGKNFDALYDCMTDPLHKSGCGPDLCSGSVMQSYSASKFFPKCAGKVNCWAIMSSTSCLLCAVARLA